MVTSKVNTMEMFWIVILFGIILFLSAVYKSGYRSGYDDGYTDGKKVATNEYEKVVDELERRFTRDYYR